MTRGRGPGRGTVCPPDEGFRDASTVLVPLDLRPPPQHRRAVPRHEPGSRTRGAEFSKFFGTHRHHTPAVGLPRSDPLPHSGMAPGRPVVATGAPQQACRDQQITRHAIR